MKYLQIETLHRVHIYINLIKTKRLNRIIYCLPYNTDKRQKLRKVNEFCCKQNLKQFETLLTQFSHIHMCNNKIICMCIHIYPNTYLGHLGVCVTKIFLAQFKYQHSWGTMHTHIHTYGETGFSEFFDEAVVWLSCRSLCGWRSMWLLHAVAECRKRPIM